MDFMTLAKERYSCRKLSDRPVEREKIEQILDCGLAAPTAVNRQSYRIWVLESPESMEKLQQITKYTFGAKVALVVGYQEEEAWVRGSDQRNFADIDAAIVATHLMLAIHDLGLGSTWVGSFDAPRLKEIYPAMQSYELIAIFPIGYPAEDAAPAANHYKKKDRDAVISCL